MKIRQMMKIKQFYIKYERLGVGGWASRTAIHWKKNKKIKKIKNIISFLSTNDLGSPTPNPQPFDNVTQNIQINNI